MKADLLEQLNDVRHWVTHQSMPPGWDPSKLTTMALRLQDTSLEQMVSLREMKVQIAVLSPRPWFGKERCGSPSQTNDKRNTHLTSLAAARVNTTSIHTTITRSLRRRKRSLLETMCRTLT